MPRRYVNFNFTISRVFANEFVEVMRQDGSLERTGVNKKIAFIVKEKEMKARTKCTLCNRVIVIRKSNWNIF